MTTPLKMTKEQAATFYRGVLAEAEDDVARQEPDDLLAQAARGVREREARRAAEFDAALGEGRR